MKEGYNKIREDRLKEISGKKLCDNAKTKIKTTMIGALAIIQDAFKDFENDPEIKRILESIRSQILDKGNTQIRNLEIEFSNYDIMYKKNTIILPLVERDDRYGK